MSIAIGTGTVKHIWTTALAGLLLVCFAAMVSTTAIAAAAEQTARHEGRNMMIDAGYRLAMTLRR
ncbi:hypothetical protein WP12_12000 [Sphingomonas sp. SRS2]|nr:hypothetical protein WP12_12000 [Sphingomonas sp. SRS2]